ncbi:MAG TPA: hypothetical protein VMV66_02850 [Candidatus Humimicrobiaceae bacterium]|nr:hypothetical protein [Candidatus Humimicrobiaceae bacterium]
MKDYENIKDEEYYSELQASIRSYDAKLWMIPGLFFVVVGLIIGNLDYVTLSFKNAIISFCGSFFLWILILLYTKAHIFHILIQKKIKEFDDKFNSIENNKRIERIPLTSMHEKKVKSIMEKLEKIKKEEEKKGEKGDVDAGAGFDRFQKFIADRRVSKWIRTIMFSAFIISSLFSIVCFIRSISLFLK